MNAANQIKKWEAEGFGLLATLSAYALNPQYTQEASAEIKRALRRLAQLKVNIERAESRLAVKLAT